MALFAAIEARRHEAPRTFAFQDRRSMAEVVREALSHYNPMTIFLGSDHAGYHLKEEIERFLAALGHRVVDLGAHRFDAEDDYPDFIEPVARAVAADPANARGIVLGGSGQGEAITANKVPGVRAALYYGGPPDIVRRSRDHNDANVLSLGARFLTAEEAKAAVKLWLEIPFPAESRHVRRIGLIAAVERRNHAGGGPPPSSKGSYSP